MSPLELPPDELLVSPLDEPPELCPDEPLLPELEAPPDVLPLEEEVCPDEVCGVSHPSCDSEFGVRPLSLSKRAS